MDDKKVPLSPRLKKALEEVAKMDEPEDVLSIEDILDPEDLLEKKDLH